MQALLHRFKTAILLGIFASILTGATNSPASESAPQNVLFVAVDDMKDWVDCLGGYEGQVKTPHIDRLARRGTLFHNAHCASPKCAPSRAALMTGLQSSTTGLYDNGHWWFPNGPARMTIPRLFGDNGYHVAGAGKIYHHTAGNNPPQQWDDYLRLTFKNDPWFRGVKKNYPWSNVSKPPAGFPFSGVNGLGHENDWGSLGIAEEMHDDALTASYAVRFLKEYKKSKPFFLACGLFRPHLPWYVPQKYFDRYPLESVKLPTVMVNDLADVPVAGRAFASARRSDLDKIRKQDKWKEAVQAYLASISFADAQLGRVLDALDASPHAKNTIVVFWSDHGWHLGEKDHWHKSTLWEEATRVPFIIATPSTEPGNCERPVSLLDVFPTLIELCQLQGMEQKLDGVSLAPLLRNPMASWDRPAVIEFRSGNAAVRSQRYRLIQYADGSQELYDHSTDPYEHHNLAAKPELQEVVARLRDWLPKRWAPSAQTKSAYTFDPSSYRWVDKKTGEIFNGDTAVE